MEITHVEPTQPTGTGMKREHTFKTAGGGRCLSNPRLFEYRIELRAERQNPKSARIIAVVEMRVYHNTKSDNSGSPASYRASYTTETLVRVPATPNQATPGFDLVLTTRPSVDVVLESSSGSTSANRPKFLPTIIAEPTPDIGKILFRMTGVLSPHDAVDGLRIDLGSSEVRYSA